MLNFDCKNFSRLKNKIAKNKSFAVSGLTSFFRLILLDKIAEFSGKKILFVTSNEQSALKYQSDYKKVFAKSSVLLPFQTISMYEGVNSNKYE